MVGDIQGSSFVLHIVLHTAMSLSVLGSSGYTVKVLVLSGMNLETTILASEKDCF
jgi:hypothetical protein